MKDLSKLEHIEQPRKGSVVIHSGWQPGKKLKGYPCDVYIVDGQYNVDGRLSNFWYWRVVNKDGTLGPEISGYGSFYRSENKYDVHIMVYKIK